LKQKIIYTLSALFLCLEEQLSDEENEILGDDRSNIGSEESGEDLFGDNFERYYLMILSF